MGRACPPENGVLSAIRPEQGEGRLGPVEHDPVLMFPKLPEAQKARDGRRPSRSTRRQRTGPDNRTEGGRGIKLIFLIPLQRTGMCAIYKIAIGLVRIHKIRFQPTNNTFLFYLSRNVFC
jgi:hypothetical protein